MEQQHDEKRRASDEDDDEGSEERKSSSSSSSSSEEDLLSDEEREEHALVLKMEAAIAQNPYNFNDHVQYIHVLRKSGMLDKLRDARAAMSSIFPLSPGMWQEWTQDETRLISSQEEVAAVEKLFEKGLQDYLSVSLWLGYLEFKRQHDEDVIRWNSAGIAKMRGLYERALGVASLHFTDGSKIWAAYRQYEIDLVNNLQDTSEEAKIKQVTCIRNVYRRQLAIPLCDTTTALKDYIKWESDQGVQIGDDVDEFAGLPANVATAYKKAQQMCSQREPLEEKISQQKPRDSEFLQNLLLYIAFEEGTGDPARVQVMYERAVVEFPITYDLWLKYTGFLEKTLKVSAIILSVYGRAVRNCPWTQALWSRYLLALERANSSEPDISQVFEQSLHSGFSFSTPEEYLDHYLTRVDGIRRKICGLLDEADKPSYVSTLRGTFNQAVEFLSAYFPNFMDGSLKLHSYWAQLESSLANDMVAARGVWENFIKSSGWMVEAWKGYISMELNLGNLVEARTIYKRCYSRRLEGNGTEVLCDAWLRFEREHGTLEDYDRALVKVTSRLAEVKQLQQQQDAKFAAAAARDLKEAGKRSSNKEVIPGLGLKKRNLQDASTPKEKRARKRPRILTAGDINEVEKVDSDSLQNAEADAIKDRAEIPSVGEEPAVQANVKGKEDLYTDQCTAYVSRLAPEVNEDDLRELFSPCNSLKALRLIKDRITGKSRGFAYVDFENEDGLNAALKLNNHKLKGSKIKVLRSDPVLGGKKGAASARRDDGHNATGPEQETSDDKDHKGKEERSSQGQGRGRGGRYNAIPVSHRRGGHVQLSGKNTFAVPRSLVRPLGFSQRGQTNEATREEPKSNEDFRKMLSK